jgi:hypothetical protein
VQSYAFVLTFCLWPQVELLGRVQKQQQDDAWYTCINYVSVCGKPLYGFTPALPSQAPAHEQKERRLLLGKVSSPFRGQQCSHQRDCLSRTCSKNSDAVRAGSETMYLLPAWHVGLSASSSSGAKLARLCDCWSSLLVHGEQALRQDMC